MPSREAQRRSNLRTSFRTYREGGRDADLEILAYRRIGCRRACGGDLFSDSAPAGETRRGASATKRGTGPARTGATHRGQIGWSLRENDIFLGLCINWFTTWGRNLRTEPFV